MTAIVLLMLIFGSVFCDMAENEIWAGVWGIISIAGLVSLLTGLFMFLWRVTP